MKRVPGTAGRAALQRYDRARLGEGSSQLFALVSTGRVVIPRALSEQGRIYEVGPSVPLRAWCVKPRDGTASLIRQLEGRPRRAGQGDDPPGALQPTDPAAWRKERLVQQLITALLSGRACAREVARERGERSDEGGFVGVWIWCVLELRRVHTA